MSTYHVRKYTFTLVRGQLVGVLMYYVVQHRVDILAQVTRQVYCLGLIENRQPGRRSVNTFFSARYIILDYKYIHILYKLSILGHQLATHTTQAYVHT